MHLPSEQAMQQEHKFALILAVPLTVIVHVLFFFSAEVPLKASSYQIPERIEPITLKLSPPPESENAQMMKFVEANPEVPQNEPDETPNVGAQNQQAAEETPEPESESEFPSTEGEFENSQKIVEGQAAEQPTPPLQPGQYTLNDDGQAQQTSQQSNPQPTPPQTAPPPPPPDFVMQEPDTEDGIGSTLQEPDTAKQEYEKTERKVIQLNRVPTAVEVTRQVQQDRAIEEAAQRGEAVPLPRPKLEVKTTPGPLRDVNVRASRMGTIAVNSRLTEFGQYFARFVETVTRQWNLLAGRTSIISSDIGTIVEIRFMLDKDGQINELEIIQSTASRPARLLCQDAIFARAPYGEWTPEMIALLGEETPVTFRFHYR